MYIPLLKSTIKNIDPYDIVFIGYPVWTTTISQAIKSFLSERDF
ncbi:flavodoxin [Clostridium sp. UBA4548]